jgi:putative ABC transport system substrate-binding protein
MKRREFIAGIGALSAIPFFPTEGHTQAAIPTIGFLHSLAPSTFAPLDAVFRSSLSEAGYVVGQNVHIEYRSAEGRSGQLAIHADDLIRRKVAVFVTATSAAALAAKAATTTIPIVFETGNDPVKLGLVASFNRPGGNLTGITQFTGNLEAKRLELLREAVPTARLIGVLVNRTRPGVTTQLEDVQQAARALGQQLVVLDARSERDLDTAFAAFIQQRVDALLVSADPFLYSHRAQLVGLAARHAVPAIYQWRDHVIMGGLMSYGTSVTDAFRQLGGYAGRVLKGEKPADLPIIQATRSN